MIRLSIPLEATARIHIEIPDIFEYVNLNSLQDLDSDLRELIIDKAFEEIKKNSEMINISWIVDEYSEMYLVHED